MRTQIAHQGTAEYRPFAPLAHKNLVQESFEVPMLLRLLEVPKGQRMLEVGCGRGVALPPLAALCEPASLTGLDTDPEALAEARERVAAEAVAAELVLGDVRELPFPDGSFDVVIDFGTCYHVGRPEAALREIARVLDAGGMFVHETPVAQLLAHPVRAFGRTLPWDAAPELVPQRSALCWASRLKREPRGGGACSAG